MMPSDLASPDTWSADAARLRLGKVAVACVLLFVGGSVGFAQAENKGLSLAAELDRSDYLIAEPIWVRCTLFNQASRDLVVPYDREGTTSSLLFDIVGPDERKIARLKYEEESIGPRSQTINAGRRYVETLNLYDEYAIAAPGQYHISAMFVSDGIYYESDQQNTRLTKKDGWKGTLNVDLGVIIIREPISAVDVAALAVISPSPEETPKDGGSAFPFLYTYSDNKLRAKLIEKHPTSRYAAYARYFQAIADLKRFRDTTNQVFVGKAHEHLWAIEGGGFPSLFRERVGFARIEVLAASGEASKARAEFREFQKSFPTSPHRLTDLAGFEKNHRRKEGEP